MGDQGRNIRYQWVRGRVHPGPEDIRLIVCQVHIAPRPEQLYLSFQLQEMWQGGNQRSPGPLADPCSGRGVDLTLE
jgi:hypothetical protein